jgi:hypothetical protein
MDTLTRGEFPSRRFLGQMPRQCPARAALKGTSASTFTVSFNGSHPEYRRSFGNMRRVAKVGRAGCTSGQLHWVCGLTRGARRGKNSTKYKIGTTKTTFHLGSKTSGFRATSSRREATLDSEWK